MSSVSTWLTSKKKKKISWKRRNDANEALKFWSTKLEVNFNTGKDFFLTILNVNLGWMLYVYMQTLLEKYLSCVYDRGSGGGE